MKKIFLPLIILALFFLGSCTETIYEEVIKLDTVFISKPQSFAPTFITVRDTVTIRDTVKVQVVIRDTVVNTIHTTDTLIQYVVKDSLIIKEVEKIVYHTDTVTIVNTVVNNVHTTDTVIVVQHDTVTLTEYVQRVVYLNTEYLFPGQSVFFIPEPLMQYYTSFIQDAQSRGKSPTGGDLIVQYVKSDELPGEGWVSGSTQMSGWQNVIYLDEGLLPEQSKAALYRELSRLELRKKYSNDVTRIMSPLFRTSPEPTTSEINQLFQ